MTPTITGEEAMQLFRFSTPAVEPSVWNSGGQVALTRPSLSRLWRRNERPKSDTIRILAGLRGTDAVVARRHFNIINVPTGTVLMNEGTSGQEFCCMLSGGATVSKLGERLTTLRGGDFFGELALLPHVSGSNGRRQATVVTDRPTRVAVCNAPSFHFLMRTFSTIQRKVLFQARYLTVQSLSDQLVDSANEH